MPSSSCQNFNMLPFHYQTEITLNCVHLLKWYLPSGHGSIALPGNVAYNVAYNVAWTLRRDDTLLAKSTENETLVQFSYCHLINVSSQGVKRSTKQA